MLPPNLYARVRVLCAQLHARPRVRRAPGLPCALYFFRGQRNAKPRADRAARSRSHVQSSSPPPGRPNGRPMTGSGGGIQYSRGRCDGVEMPRRTGSPPSRGRRPRLWRSCRQAHPSCRTAHRSTAANLPLANLDWTGAGDSGNSLRSPQDGGAIILQCSKR